jgi:hypothetical protein
MLTQHGLQQLKPKVYSMEEQIGRPSRQTGRIVKGRRLHMKQQPPTHTSSPSRPTRIATHPETKDGFVKVEIGEVTTVINLARVFDVTPSPDGVEITMKTLLNKLDS